MNLKESHLHIHITFYNFLYNQQNSVERNIQKLTTGTFTLEVIWVD